MGFLAEILKKAKASKAPYLNISRDQVEDLRNGVVLEIPDSKTGERYNVQIEPEKIGSQDISKKDLVITPATAKLPKVAKAPPEAGL